MLNRRELLKLSAAGLVTAPVLSSQAAQSIAAHHKTLLAKHLNQGDTVALVAPAGAINERVELDIAIESLQALGLKVITGKHVLARDGYFAGTDAQRAADVNWAFSNPTIKGVIALRGGWGCNRILPLLDMANIARHPKILLGYSDITALLNGLYTQTGLVGFHGPVGTSYWDKFQARQMTSMLFDGHLMAIENPPDNDSDTLTRRDYRIQTLRSGKADGIIVGGNLTVFSSLTGSAYQPDLTGKILFLEDVEESLYRIDRYLSTLQLAGQLQGIAGLAFGQCSKCTPEKGYGGFTLRQILEHYLLPLNIPCFMGGQFGHIKDSLTLPVGVKVRLDADRGEIKMLTPALR